MLVSLFFISLILYGPIVLFFASGLFHRARAGNPSTPTVTVVIAAKNEQDHIERILTELTHQTYPVDRTEIVLVDDESTDLTPNICRAFADKYGHVQCLSTEGLSSPLRFKKRPLDLGIRKAGGEIVLLTDADCHVPSTWIDSMVSTFQPDVGLVIGYSETRPVRTRFERFQALDFLLLMAAARGAARWRQPFGCTGQNLAYRRQVFEEVGGFSRFARAVGGDDTLLLQQVKHRTRWKIVFAADPAGAVASSPVATLRQYLSQRLRWASDALRVPRLDPFLFAILTTVFLVNCFVLLTTISLFWNPANFLPWIAGLTAKFSVEGIFVLAGTRTFKKSRLLPAFPTWFMVQAPYVVIVTLGILLNRSLRWGGRHS